MGHIFIIDLLPVANIFQVLRKNKIPLFHTRMQVCIISCLCSGS